MDVKTILIAFIGSTVAGGLNTLAGNGSAITLTILIELLGLPPNVANATNRIGIFTQSVGTTLGFKQVGVLNWSRSAPFIIITVIGALAGIILAMNVSNEAFKNIFKILMLFMLVVMLIKPKHWLIETDPHYKPNWWIGTPLFLFLGFYGGFIQMGMGIFFLAVMTLGARFSLMESNALKSPIVGIYTLLAIIIFAQRGMIDWKMGALMAVGQTLGGYFTARYAPLLPNANLWAYRILVAVVIVALVMLFS